MISLRLAARDLRLLFRSPLPWVLLAVSQAVAAWWFLTLVEQFQSSYEPMLVRTDSPLGVTDLVLLPFFGSFVVLGMLVLAAAVLAMRLLAEGRRSGAMQLLYSAPLSMTSLVLGKYLGALGFLLLPVIAWLVMPTSLAAGTTLDLGRLAAAGLALGLLASVLAAIAVFASSLTVQPAIAAAVTVVLVLALFGIDTVGRAAGDPVTGYLALVPHYETLLQGQVGSVNMVYFLVLTVGFLALAVLRLDAVRLRGS